MLQINAYATALTVILAVVLAVARDVPVLHVFLPPNTNAGLWASLLVAPLIAAAILWGRSMPSGSVGHAGFAIAWEAGLVYFWWCMAWHLRERR